MAEKEEKEGMTLGQRLALKHQIVERPKVKSPTPPPVAIKADSGDESEWTWEALDQLVDDVPVLIAKYVLDEDHHQLTAVHRRCVQQAAAAT